MNGQLIPNVNDCNSFFQCEYEKATLHYCDTGLLFDPNYSVCNWPQFVTCGDTPTLPPRNSSTTVSPPVSETTLQPSTNSPISTTPAPITYSSPQTTESSPSVTTTRTTTILIPDDTEATTKAPFDPENPDCSLGPRFFPHPYDETRYFICVAGMPVEMQCPEFNIWNHELSRCDPIYYISPMCESDAQFLPHPTDVHRYFICISGLPVEMVCPNLNVWDNVQSRCIVSPSHALPSPGIPNCDGSATYYPNIFDCTQFYICIGENPLEMTCPEDSFWDQSLLTCHDDSRVACSRVGIYTEIPL